MKEILLGWFLKPYYLLTVLDGIIMIIEFFVIFIFGYYIKELIERIKNKWKK